MTKALRDLIKKNVMTPGEKFTKVDDEGLTKTEKGTRKFAGKHTVDRVDDANGNDDKHFKATNIKQAPYPRAHASDGVSEETIVEYHDEVTANPISHFSHHLSAANEHLRNQDTNHFASQSNHRKAKEAESRKDKKLAEIYKDLGNHYHQVSTCHTEAAQEHLRKHLDKEMKMGEEFLIEFDQLDEVSKNKLISYIDKAAGDLGATSSRMSTYGAPGLSKKYANRRGGINKAAKKLSGIRMMSSKDNGANATRVPATEETELDEVSKALARRYALKSAEDQVKINDKSIKLGNDTNGYVKHKTTLDKLTRKFANRDKGLATANKRLPGGKIQPRF